jgi:predicted DNA-binding helix-hairpin-helix protein
LHLKLMPGAQKAQVERSMQLADRVSVNLEAPNTQRLERLAPRKNFMEELLQPLRWVEEIRRSQPAHLGWKGRWPSMTTQFVVGAAGESDLELLSTTAHLTQQLRLSRAYFSAFSPIEDTPLDHLPPESPLRQNRLYQASFLLRDYGFSLEDLPFEGQGDLPRQVDPKLAWARNHLSNAPVEINTASRESLLRIPGIGPKNAEAILAARRKGHLHALEDLKKLGITPSRAAPFILLDGRRPMQQMRFW